MSNYKYIGVITCVIFLHTDSCYGIGDNVMFHEVVTTTKKHFLGICFSRFLENREKNVSLVMHA